MRIIKGIIGILLAVVFALSCGLTLGSYAASNALSEAAVEKAIVETGAVEKLTDEILARTTTNMGGEYGDAMQAIMESDAMTDFFATYTATCLQDKVLNRPTEEIANDEFANALMAGMDECEANGSIGMGDFQRDVFDAAVSAVMPQLTAGVNAVLDQMELTDFVDDETDAKIETLRALTSDGFRTVALLVTIISAGLLLFLFWRRKRGMLWIAIIMLLIGGAFELAALTFYNPTEGPDTSLYLSEQMLNIMMHHGLQSMAGLAGLIGVLLLPLRAILKRIL